MEDNKIIIIAHPENFSELHIDGIKRLKAQGYTVIVTEDESLIEQHKPNELIGMAIKPSELFMPTEVEVYTEPKKEPWTSKYDGNTPRKKGKVKRKKFKKL